MDKHIDERLDERTVFTPEEYVHALSLIMPAAEAEECFDSTFRITPGDLQPGTAISPDMLDLLALVSPSCAERARGLLHLAEDEAAARWARAREQLRNVT